MSTEISVDIAVDLAVDSRCKYYPQVFKFEREPHRFLNLNGSQTRISTIGSKVINVSYNTINQTTGKYNLGDFTKTVTLFKN